ncbi:MAG: helix-turn-helix domain-containing protein [Steroidobacteraceae bacterium]
MTMSNADLLRQRLQDLGLSQREAARQLQVDERAMRRYCAGSAPVPPLLFLALDRLVKIQRINCAIDLLKNGAMVTSDGPVTLERLEAHVQTFRQAIAMLEGHWPAPA